MFGEWKLFAVACYAQLATQVRRNCYTPESRAIKTTHELSFHCAIARHVHVRTCLPVSCLSVYIVSREGNELLQVGVVSFGMP